jgi:uracil-DNA glycosylase
MPFRRLPPAWVAALGLSSSEATDLSKRIDALYSATPSSFTPPTVYPLRDEVFRAFHQVAPTDVRMVILGQDPYPQPSGTSARGIADGLAFSAAGHRPPGSLRQLLYNLWETGEISDAPSDASLQRWADQGVLLINTALSVEPAPTTTTRDTNRRRHQAVYRSLIRRVLRQASALKPPPAFLLVGAEAKKFEANITVSDPEQVIKTRHPSRGDWPGPLDPVEPFSAANRFLGARAVDWRL